MARGLGGGPGTGPLGRLETLLSAVNPYFVSKSRARFLGGVGCPAWILPTRGSPAPGRRLSFRGTPKQGGSPTHGGSPCTHSVRPPGSPGRRPLTTPGRTGLWDVPGGGTSSARPGAVPGNLGGRSPWKPVPRGTRCPRADSLPPSKGTGPAFPLLPFDSCRRCRKVARMIRRIPR